MSGLKCDNCGKGVMFGHNVSHSKRRTQKIFKPNLHQTRVVLDGIRVRKRLCTKCLRMYKNLAKELTTTSEVSTQTSA